MSIEAIGDAMASAMPARIPIMLLDTVALVEDVPTEGLGTGEVGTVVEVLAPGAFEVEFVDDEGYTYALATLRSDQLVRLDPQAVPKPRDG